MGFRYEIKPGGAPTYEATIDNKGPETLAQEVRFRETGKTGDEVEVLRASLERQLRERGQKVRN